MKNRSPLSIVVILALSIYGAENFLMYAILPNLHLSKGVEIIFVSVFLLLLLTPVVYFVIYLPMSRFIENHVATEARLQLSEEHNRLTQHAGSFGLWDWDIAGNLFQWSEKAEVLLGCELPLAGRTYETFLNCIHPDDRALVDSAVRRSLSGEAACDIDHRILWPDGTVHWIRETGVVSRDAAGQPVRMAGIARDITERKRASEQLRDQERFLRAVIDALTHPFYVINTFDYTIALANKVTGMSEGLAIPMTCHLLTHQRPTPCGGDDHPCTVRGVLANRGPFITEHIHFDSAGRRRHMEVHGYPLFNEQGEILQIIEYSLDITDRKKTEEALREARDEAERANLAKSEFLANMSHEIRTPMNGVIGLTDLVLTTRLETKQRQYLEMVHQSAKRLMDLLNSILDLSKIEARKLELENIAFTFREMIDNSLKLFAVKAHEKGLELAAFVERGTPETLIGDPGRLRQIITNLVANAIKFTEQGEVVVEVRPSSPGAGQAEREKGIVELHFLIRDTGIGIPLEKQEAIFSAFTQADGSFTREYGGTGLGLSICSQLVKLMGGRIWVESKVRKGAVFHFTLPLRKKEGTGTEPRPKVNAIAWDKIGQLRFLIVEPSTTWRYILNEMLAEVSPSVEFAESGPEALEVLRSREVDVVLLETKMPGMSGFELAETITKQDRTGRMKIIALSSLGEQGDGLLCRKMGIHGYLLKPVSQLDLLQTLNIVTGTDAIAGKEDNLVTRHSLREKRQAIHILLAEDDPINQFLAEELITAEGCRLTIAGDGQQVLDHLAQGTFDMILMDVMMPGMDGVMATKAIRKQEEQRGGHIPIIALTAHALSGDREQFIDAGMDGYVAKPVDKVQLWREIERVFGQKTMGSLGGRGDSPPSGRDIFDQDRFLLERCLGNRMLAHKLLDYFVNIGGPQALVALNEAVAGRDTAQIRKLCHTLEGSAATLCAQVLSTAAASLGCLARDGRLDELGEGGAELETVYIETHRRCRQALERDGGSQNY